MSSPVQAVPSPLRDFLEYLLHSRDTAGIIKLVYFHLSRCFNPHVLVHRVPATILENTTQYLSELSSVPINHVEEMLAVIDHEESVICSRLELRTFTVVYEILSLTEEGSAYERGLALLTVGTFSKVQAPKTELHSNHYVRFPPLRCLTADYGLRRKPRWATSLF